MTVLLLFFFFSPLFLLLSILFCNGDDGEALLEGEFKRPSDFLSFNTGD